MVTQFGATSPMSRGTLPVERFHYIVTNQNIQASMIITQIINFMLLLQVITYLRVSP